MTVGVAAGKPGDSFFSPTDVRFSHEYVTPMAEALFHRGFGADANVSEPESVYAFRDHLTFLDLVMPKAHKDLGLDRQARTLASVQDAFARRHGVKLYGEVHRDGRLVGSEAICHNKVIEEIALPGQLVVGTDSHTCMAGALGCFAFGVGSTDMANAWMTRDVRVTVPHTVRLVLTGRLRDGVCAKDVMLHVLSRPFFKSGEAIGVVLEFAGEGVGPLPLDERATLTNMAVEAGLHWHHRGRRGGRRLPGRAAAPTLPTCGGASFVPDPGASYCATFEIDLAAVVPWWRRRADPRNGVPLAKLGADVKIDIAYARGQEGGHGSGRPRSRPDALGLRQRVARGAPSTCSSAPRRSAALRRSWRGTWTCSSASAQSFVDPRAGRASRRAPARATFRTR